MISLGRWVSTRAQVQAALDGTHARLGRSVALALNGLILISATAIALETVETLPTAAYTALRVVEVTVLLLFAVEYVTRLICAPRPLSYALSFWGIIDLIAILPLLAVLNADWTALRTLRLIRLVRLLKLIRTSQSLDRLLAALHQVRGDLAVAGALASIVVYIAAVGIYALEHEAQPEAFGSIPEAAWWAIVSFTTVGYGDAYPITPGGRAFTVAILFVGLGIIALPTAAITSALITEARNPTPRKDPNEPAPLPLRPLQRPYRRRRRSAARRRRPRPR